MSLPHDPVPRLGVPLMHDEGFAIVPEVFSGVEVAALADELGQFPLERSRAGARHVLKCPAVARLAHDQRLLRLAADALGSDPRPFGARLFDKSAVANWLVVWHQDTALPVPERREAPGWGPWSTKAGILYAHAPASALERVVALRVHLDDSESSNGPLRVLPGSHRKGVLRDDEIKALAERVEAVACVAPRGSVVMMRPLLVHASSKATGTAPRRVVHIEYVASPGW